MELTNYRIWCYCMALMSVGLQTVTVLMLMPCGKPWTRIIYENWVTTSKVSGTTALNTRVWDNLDYENGRIYQLCIFFHIGLCFLSLLTENINYQSPSTGCIHSSENQLIHSIFSLSVTHDGHYSSIASAKLLRNALLFLIMIVIIKVFTKNNKHMKVPSRQCCSV